DFCSCKICTSAIPGGRTWRAAPAASLPEHLTPPPNSLRWYGNLGAFDQPVARMERSGNPGFLTLRWYTGVGAFDQMDSSFRWNDVRWFRVDTSFGTTSI